MVALWSPSPSPLPHIFVPVRITHKPSSGDHRRRRGRGDASRTPWVSRLVAPLVAAATLLATSAPGRAATSSWNVSRDWAVGANPDGAWSYGWESSRGSSFNLVTIHSVDGSHPGVGSWLGGIVGVGGP